MELKKYNEYTDKEKKELLFHWWRYYGRTVCSLGVMKKFIDMVSDDIDKVFEIGLVSFVKGDNGKGLISALRDDSVEEYYEEVKELLEDDSVNTKRTDIEDIFLEMLVSSYENKEDYVMSHNEYVAGVMSILGEDDDILTSDKVISLYKNCLFKEQELKDDYFGLSISFGQGMRNVGIFNAARLEQNKNEIVAMVDQLADIDNVPSLLDLNIDKNRRIWTDSFGVIDMLVQLGTATEILTCLFVRNDDSAVVPMVVRQKSKDFEKVKDNLSCELPKVFEKYKRVSN